MEQLEFSFGQGQINEQTDLSDITEPNVITEQTAEEPKKTKTKVAAKKVMPQQQNRTTLDFSTLNEMQREAVETIDGPVLIIAGPGTGKTTILTYRIANILKVTDTAPSSILAMTYTEAGVYAMKTKLLDLIGPDAYKVNISTIHSFCNSVIQEYPEYFMHIQGFSPLTPLEKIQVSKEILSDPVFSILCPPAKPDMYLTMLPNVLSTMKREYITSEKLLKSIALEETILESMDKYVSRGPNKGKKLTDPYQRQLNKVEKLKELLIFYEKYQAIITERKRYDYDDMIISVLEMMKNNEELLSTLQEKYQYFLIDEYQDTNDAQNELLFMLASHWGEEANFFAVGDDDQSIYRFQGASVKNIKDFLRVFPNAKIITLKENYRSQQTILDASRAFVRNNSSSIEQILSGVDKQLISRAKELPEGIKTLHFSSYVAENMFVADEIKKLIDSGTEPDQLAVLVHDNRDMDDVIDMLQRKKIPYIRRAGNDILKNRYIRQLLNILRITSDVTNSPSDDASLYKVLHYPYFNLPKVDIIKLARHVSKTREKNLWEYIFDSANHDTLGGIDIAAEGIEKIKEFFSQITGWAADSEVNTLSKLIEKVINESGLLDHILRLNDKFQELNALNSFFTEVKSINTGKPDLTLKEFIEIIDIMTTYNIVMKERDIGLSKGGVNILTAHSSKGLEYDYVFIPKLFYKKWDNRFNRELLALPESLVAGTEKSEQIEEERRLFFVAMTRARKNMYLSYADTYGDEGGRAANVNPSQFLSEIPEEMVSEIETEKYQELITDKIEELLRTNPYEHVYINTVEEKEILRSILKNYRLSPTDLNTYLYCPMEFMLKVVLRTPSAMAPVMVYGSAYHKALELFYLSKMKEKYFTTAFSVDEFVNSFAKELKRYPLTEAQYQRLLKKGQKNLPMYYEQALKNVANKPLRLEHRLSGIQIGGAQLSGRIDRIDELDSVTRSVALCDYKTGGILGDSDLRKTPTLKLDKMDKGQKYYNQLMFYKVAADLDPMLNSMGITATQGKLIFIDPDKEQFIERTLEYERDQVEEMKALIIHVWQEIQKLEFPRRHTKDTDDCSACKIGI